MECSFCTIDIRIPHGNPFLSVKIFIVVFITNYDLPATLRSTDNPLIKTTGIDRAQIKSTKNIALFIDTVIRNVLCCVSF